MDIWIKALSNNSQKFIQGTWRCINHGEVQQILTREEIATGLCYNILHKVYLVNAGLLEARERNLMCTASVKFVKS
jgi:hypothetical protein